MFSYIRAVDVPQDALLQSYARREECYADCFRTEVNGTVDLPAFLTAFYKTPLFRFERRILGWCVGKPSSDAEVDALAAGHLDAFAVWTVEGQAPNQILLCDMVGRTRSWLMVRHQAQQTVLFFGSAVVPAKPDDQDIGAGFKLFEGLHRFYARALLASGRKSLIKARPD